MVRVGRIIKKLKINHYNETNYIIQFLEMAGVEPDTTTYIVAYIGNIGKMAQYMAYMIQWVGEYRSHKW